MDDEVTKSQLMAVIETMNDKFQQVLECFTVHSNEISELKVELKEDIALVDAKIMGLAKRVDHLDLKIDKVEDNLNKRIDKVEDNLNKRIDKVENRLSGEIADIHQELIAHRDNVELHRTPKKRILKKVG